MLLLAAVRRVLWVKCVTHESFTRGLSEEQSRASLSSLLRKGPEACRRTTVPPSGGPGHTLTCSFPVRELNSRSTAGCPVFQLIKGMAGFNERNATSLLFSVGSALPCFYTVNILRIL